MGGLLMAANLVAQNPTSGPPTKLDADECAVWQRELTFAQSVEKHDAKAFAAHLHPGAVFSAAPPPRFEAATLWSRNGRRWLKAKKSASGGALTS